MSSSSFGIPSSSFKQPEFNQPEFNIQKPNFDIQQPQYESIPSLPPYQPTTDSYKYKVTFEDRPKRQNR